MDDYQEMNTGLPHGMDRGSAALPLHPPQPHQRHKKQTQQYVGSAAGYGPPTHGQPMHGIGHQQMGSMPPAGYEWGGYPAQAQAQAGVQEGHMHGVSSRGVSHAPTHRVSTAQPLRVKVSERLHQIDRETFENEERVYQQKGEEIQNDMTMILRGTHPAFVDGVARLAAERDRMLVSAEQNHQYLVAMYERAYKQEREQAEQAYNAEKQIIYDRIAADIDDRRKRLKEEKDSQDITIDFVFDSGSRTSSKRNLRKRGAGLDSLALLGDPVPSRLQSKRKAVPAVSLQGICEDDIVNDLLAIRRATGVTGPLTTAVNGKKNAKTNKR
ncbi:hypothetical protein GGI20_005860 [Coemansia sp. BCRC 34301]|nr:hypothetical protein GGI20_005860 [Coemansia sp. BCRC 34301]